MTLDDDEDEDGMVVDEWLVARCKLLPKKGDLGLCKNWRGICLLDIASKILDSVLVQRLQAVMEEEGMESQTGLMELLQSSMRCGSDRNTTWNPTWLSSISSKRSILCHERHFGRYSSSSDSLVISSE